MAATPDEQTASPAPAPSTAPTSQASVPTPDQASPSQPPEASPAPTSEVTNTAPDAANSRPGPHDRSNSRPDACVSTGFDPDAGRTGRCPQQLRADKPEPSPCLRAGGSGSGPYGISDTRERQPDADEPSASVHPRHRNHHSRRARRRPHRKAPRPAPPQRARIRSPGLISRQGHSPPKSLRPQRTPVRPRPARMWLRHLTSKRRTLPQHPPRPRRVHRRQPRRRLSKQAHPPAPPRARPQLPRLLMLHRAQLLRHLRHPRAKSRPRHPTSRQRTSLRPSLRKLPHHRVQGQGLCKRTPLPAQPQRARARRHPREQTIRSRASGCSGQPGLNERERSCRTRAAIIKPGPGTVAVTGNIGRFTPDGDCTRTSLRPNDDEPEHSPCIPRAHREPGDNALSGIGEHQSSADEPRRGHGIGPADFEPRPPLMLAASTQATSQTSTQTGPVQAVSDPANVAEAVDPAPSRGNPRASSWRRACPGTI